MFDLLSLCGLSKDERLIKFLNLQLKLYSQEDVFNTAALYGSTVLQISQQPHGLWHLKKSMQALSKSLEASLQKTGVNIMFSHKVNSINFDKAKSCWKVFANFKNKNLEYFADDIIYTLPQSLLNHLDESSDSRKNYKKRLRNLPEPSGAVVFIPH